MRTNHYVDIIDKNRISKTLDSHPDEFWLRGFISKDLKEK